jgi:hypothetical protein
MNAPSIDRDVTVTVTGSVASELIARAGLGFHYDAIWRLPDGELTTDPERALTAALVAIAEEEV